MITKKYVKDLYLGDKVVVDYNNLLDDYTAFEVFPTTKEIPAGTYDSIEVLSEIFNWTDEDKYQMYEQNIKFNDELQYTVPVEAENKLIIYLEITKKDNNIVIDFGDGSDQFILNDELKKQIVDDTEENKYIDGVRYCDSSLPGSVVIQHTYNKSRKYKVKIYGSDYYTLRGFNCYNYFKHANTSNLICRLFEGDCSVASCLTNISSMGAGSGDNTLNTRLLRFNQNQYYDFKNVRNLAGFLGRCVNLLYADFSYILLENNMYSYNSLFLYDSNLISTNFYFTTCGLERTTGYSTTFTGCKNLNIDINNLIRYPFKTNNIRLIKTFTGCEKIHGDIPADKLWNYKYGSFITESTFSDCTSLDLTKIPASWGGTGPEPAIDPGIDPSSLLEGINFLSSDNISMQNIQVVLQQIVTKLGGNK